MNGIAIRVHGPQKQIVNTDWFPSGVFIDHMTITLNYNTQNPTEPELPENSRIVTGKIFKRHPKNHLLLSSTDLNFLHKPGICNTVGVQPKNVQNNLCSNAVLYFDAQYEYRIELYTEAQLSEQQILNLDYIQLNYISNLNYLEGYIDSDQVDSVPIIESNDNLSINIDTNGYGEAILTTKTLNSTTTTNMLYNLFYSINSVHVTLKDPYDWF